MPAVRSQPRSQGPVSTLLQVEKGPWEREGYARGASRVAPFGERIGQRVLHWNMLSNSRHRSLISG